ncbi:MAG: hypothetical protein K6G90_05715 [Clostridia bacterium]|nr:hypothetical protein [Clostridia bacterium]
MKKVLIEFFDEENLNNCISQLYFDYDEIHYLYYADQKKIFGIDLIFDALSEFNQRKMHLDPHYVRTGGNDADGIIAAISRIVNDQDSFDFDLTGGPESFVFTLGRFVSDRKPDNVRVHYFDFQRKKFFRIFPGYTEEITEQKRVLNVVDLVMLQGSAVSNSLLRGRNEFRPNLSEQNFSDNILRVWNSVKDHPREWNTFCTLKNENSPWAPSDEILKKFTSIRMGRCRYFLTALEKAGIIDIIVLNGELVRYRINLPENQRLLLDKGGSAFEMYAYHTALSSGVFADCSVGVNVDWDGCVQDRPEEVTNEVDLILSNGFQAAFISCKNTEIRNEHVYEIDTVAHYYGGKYAKPVIFSSVEATKAIRNRAKESEIILIDNIAAMTLDEFTERIRDLLYITEKHPVCP